MKSIYPTSLALLPFVLVGCGASYARNEAAMAPRSQNPNDDSVLAVQADSADYKVASNESAPAGEVTATGSAAGGTTAPPPPTPSTTTPTANDPSAAPNPHEMFDIEASMTLEVESLVEARAHVRDLVERLHGDVVADQLNADSGYAHAHFDLRIPAGGANGFLESIGKIGRVKSESLQAKDVGKEYYDAQLRLASLEKAMARYEELLAIAKAVPEVLQIEQQITALRTEIEQVKGNLRWLRDRVARATFHIDLEPEHPGESTWSPEAKLHPGLRLTQLTDFHGHGVRDGFIGGGLSIFFLRSFAIDVDVARRTNHTGGFLDDIDAFLLMAGGDIYSDFFGAGRRTFMNPYIGLRFGYARIDSRPNAAIAGSFGLELLKTKSLLIDLGLRVHCFFGNKTDGAHVGIQPALSMNITF